MSNFNDFEQKGWSNASGYGNLILTSYCSKPGSNKVDFKTRSHPWNRLEKLDKPYCTTVDTKMAWTPPVSTDLNKVLFETCNLCPKHAAKTDVKSANQSSYE